MISDIIKKIPIKVDNLEKIDFIGDSGIGYYKILSKEKILFLKIYNQSRKEDYLIELYNYNLIYNNLRNLPKKHLFFEANEHFCILYNFIDGKSLYCKNNEDSHDKDSYLKIIKDVVKLQGISKNKIKETSTLNWFEREFINNLQAKDVLKEEIFFLYELIDPYIQSVAKEFSGIYSDRNPRNILFDAKENLYHIDFEVLWFVSPIFDLVKLLRNGFDYLEINTQKISSYNLFNEDEEQKFLFYFIEELSKIKPNILHNLSINPKIVIIKYNLVCLFIHLLYVAYYSSELKRKKDSIKYNRQIYH
ncbi:phosphotransferase, partial [Patescibacteria group bacterium]